MTQQNTSNAEKYLVGQVSSGWNSLRETGHITIDRAGGAKVWDIKGNEYIDWIMGWGSLLLGHNPASVREGIEEAISKGLGYQYETLATGELAKEICHSVPGAEKVRLANTGSEATLHALRVARKVTGKKKVVKFEGHFHGLNDYLLFGVDCNPTLGNPREDGSIEAVSGSGGLPDDSLSPLIIVLPFNDLDALEKTFQRHGSEIAAVILEPIALNIGCIAPDPGFLGALKKVCKEHDSLLIFDEVLTGFRVARGGASERFGVTADLVCLGKALGNGMPMAALAGKKEYMEVLTPKGNVQMAGTNTGRNLSVCGALAGLRALGQNDFYQKLDALNDYAVRGLYEVFSHFDIPVYIEGYGGRIGVYLGIEERPRNFRDVVSGWNQKFHCACYRHCYYDKSLYGFLLPLGICPEPITLSALHTIPIIDETLNRLQDVLRSLPYERNH